MSNATRETVVVAHAKTAGRGHEPQSCSLFGEATGEYGATAPSANSQVFNLVQVLHPVELVEHLPEGPEYPPCVSCEHFNLCSDLLVQLQVTLKPCPELIIHVRRHIRGGHVCPIPELKDSVAELSNRNSAIAAEKGLKLPVIFTSHKLKNDVTGHLQCAQCGGVPFAKTDGISCERKVYFSSINTTVECAEAPDPRNCQALIPQSILPVLKRDEIFVTLLCGFIRALHDTNGPPRCKYRENTAQEGLKVEKEIAPAISTMLAVDYSRFSPDRGHENTENYQDRQKGSECTTLRHQWLHFPHKFFGSEAITGGVIRQGSAL